MSTRAATRRGRLMSEADALRGGAALCLSSQQAGLREQAEALMVVLRLARAGAAPAPRRK